MRVHPITIVANLWRVLYLVIVPVVRGFFYAVQGNFSSWLSSAWIDILIFLFMIAIAVLRWRGMYYFFTAAHMHISRRFILHRDTYIPWNRVVTLSVVSPFYLRPFRAVRLRADTAGGRHKHADLSILLSPAQAQELLHASRRVEKDAAPPTLPREYIPKTRSILALAFLTSNSLVGIVFIATFTSQTGKLLGNEFSAMLVGTLENAARILAFGVPPAAAAIAYLLLIGWVAGFILTFLQYRHFAVRQDGDTLSVQGGMFTTRSYYIKYADINFIDIRQSLLSRALKLYSLYISAIGYEKDKRDISCIIPTEQETAFENTRAMLFPGLNPTPRTIMPTIRGLWRFLAVPVSILAAISVAMTVCSIIFTGWIAFILFVGLMSLVPATLFLIIRIVEYRTTGISISGDYYTIRYSSAFYIHTVVIPTHAIVQMELRQSVFQRRSNTCDLLVYTKAEGRVRHLCRSLSKAQLETLLAC